MLNREDFNIHDRDIEEVTNRNDFYNLEDYEQYIIDCRLRLLDTFGIQEKV